jgi:hypothetical protein
MFILNASVRATKLRTIIIKIILLMIAKIGKNIMYYFRHSQVPNLDVHRRP